MLSVGKVVVFFSRFVAIFGKKYESFWDKFLLVKIRFRLFYEKKEKMFDDHQARA